MILAGQTREGCKSIISEQVLLLVSSHIFYFNYITVLPPGRSKLNSRLLKLYACECANQSVPISPGSSLEVALNARFQVDQWPTYLAGFLASLRQESPFAFRGLKLFYCIILILVESVPHLFDCSLSLSPFLPVPEFHLQNYHTPEETITNHSCSSSSSTQHTHTAAKQNNPANCSPRIPSSATPVREPKSTWRCTISAWRPTRRHR